MALTHCLGPSLGTANPEFIRVRSEYGHLDISIRKTVRVADNEVVRSLSPDFGAYTLHQVSQYPNLPRKVRATESIFLPVQDKQPLMLQFRATAPFAVKVRFGDINALGTIAGSTDPNGRYAWREIDGEEDRPVQLDGFPISKDIVRQFVVVSGDSEKSFEYQVTGQNLYRSLQFDVAPLQSFKKDSFTIILHPVRTLSGKVHQLTVSSNTTIAELQELIVLIFSVPEDLQLLMCKNAQVAYGKNSRSKWLKLGSLGIGPGDRIGVSQAFRSGGKFEQPVRFHKMGHDPFATIAPGGKMQLSQIRNHQRDGYYYRWDKDHPLAIKVAFVNFEVFHKATKVEPDGGVMGEKAYSQLNGELPFFTDDRCPEYDEKTTCDCQIEYPTRKDGKPLESIGLNEECQPIPETPVDPESGRSVVVSPIDWQLAELMQGE